MPPEPVDLPTARVTIGDDTFDVELAIDRDAQSRGLSGRSELAPDTGMLFVFSEPHIPSFWMAGTFIPLDIAFIRADLTIASIQTMEPLSLRTHAPDEPVLYALEVLAGELERRQIRLGDRVQIEQP